MLTACTKAPDSSTSGLALSVQGPFNTEKQSPFLPEALAATWHPGQLGKESCPGWLGQHVQSCRGRMRSSMHAWLWARGCASGWILAKAP